MSAPAVSAATTVLHQEELLIRADRTAVMATLARGMAHDLRGPLQTLTLMVDPHADVFGSPEGARLMGAVSTAVQHLSETIARFSQVYAPVETEPSPLIVEELLTYVSDLQRYQRGLAVTEMSLRITSGLPPVRGMESHLRHVLLSLIVNAKQALTDRADGQITLGAEQRGSEIRLSVEDNGPGMSEETLARAFEPFFTTREGGMGIGLTVGRWLTERMGGRLTLEPGRYGGMNAVVTLSEWRRGEGG
ncbi:MAG TPA: HAMP domain-containing sensor histidine kinase [Gemmatimonadales bacterium]|nr:HAMP domain-containing sensor histidine kinase [Gemmatimonadales bacterium]